MATDIGFSANSNKRPGNILTWTATILACAYVVSTGVMLYVSMPKFVEKYISMGVELPLPTKIVIGFYRLGFPVLFGGATVLLIGKQFSVREKWPNLIITLATVVMADIISRTIIWALYRPMFDLMEKLNK
jgi:type II secretory pathway component PulF